MTYQEPAWVEYAGDAFFVILFLIVYFFFKPDENVENKDEELADSAKPNELEKVLVTEPVEEKNLEDDNTETKKDN